MIVWAIVPVKHLVEAKSRLNEVLGPVGREKLVCDLVCRTLDLLATTQGVSDTILVSTDPAVLDLAGRCNSRPLMEETPPDLNRALNQATNLALEAGAEAVLVVPADLPLVEAADLEAVLTLLAYPTPGKNSVVAVPDRHGTGTNLLALKPPGVIEYCFGPGSLVRHRDACMTRGVPFHTLQNPRLVLDLDLPEDLALWRPTAGQQGLLLGCERCRIGFEDR